MRKTAIAVAAALLAGAPLAFAEHEWSNTRDPYYQSSNESRDWRDDPYRESRRGEFARVIQSRPVYATDSKQECWNPRAGHYEEVRAENKSRVGKGAAIGAVAGGVLGHQVGSGRGNDAATVGGALLGGLLGHQLEKRNDANPQDDLDFSRCRVAGGSDVNRYEVRYVYDGQEYVTYMDRDPGARLRLGEDIRPDGTPYG